MEIQVKEVFCWLLSPFSQVKAGLIQWSECGPEVRIAGQQTGNGFTKGWHFSNKQIRVHELMALGFGRGLCPLCLSLPLWPQIVNPPQVPPAAKCWGAAPSQRPRPRLRTRLWHRLLPLCPRGTQDPPSNNPSVHRLLEKVEENKAF